MTGTDGYILENNLLGDPLLIDITNEDYHLQGDSPCINMGATPLATLDYEGNMIPNSSLADIGIYESQIPLSNGYLDLSTATSPYTFSAGSYYYQDDFSNCYSDGRSDVVSCIDLADGERLVISGRLTNNNYISASLEAGSCGTGTEISYVSYANNDQFVYDNHSGSTEQVCFFMNPRSGEYGYFELGGKYCSTYPCK